MTLEYSTSASATGLTKICQDAGTRANTVLRWRDAGTDAWTARQGLSTSLVVIFVW